MALRLLGRGPGYFHICHMCQGKAAKRLHRQVVKREKRREERAWRQDYSRE